MIRDKVASIGKLWLMKQKTLSIKNQTLEKENNVMDVSRMLSDLLIFSLQNGQKVKVINV
jgi:hypothetical protein